MHKKVVCVHTYFVWCGVKNKKKKKNNTNKIRQLSGTYFSETTGFQIWYVRSCIETTGAISFKFGM